MLVTDSRSEARKGRLSILVGIHLLVTEWQELIDTPAIDDDEQRRWRLHPLSYGSTCQSKRGPSKTGRPLTASTAAITIDVVTTSVAPGRLKNWPYNSVNSFRLSKSRRRGRVFQSQRSADSRDCDDCSILGNAGSLFATSTFHGICESEQKGLDGSGVPAASHVMMAIDQLSNSTSRTVSAVVARKQ